MRALLASAALAAALFAAAPAWSQSSPPPDFNLTVTPADLYTEIDGQQTSATITVTSLNGFSDFISFNFISFKLQGQPSLPDFTFSAATGPCAGPAEQEVLLNPGASCSVNVKFNAPTLPGNYAIDVGAFITSSLTAPPPPIGHVSSLTLHVTAPATTVVGTPTFRGLDLSQRVAAGDQSIPVLPAAGPTQAQTALLVEIHNLGKVPLRFFSAGSFDVTLQPGQGGGLVVSAGNVSQSGVVVKNDAQSEGLFRVTVWQ
jgi:hypothetical protein